MKFLKLYLIGNIYGQRQPDNFWGTLEKRTAWTVDLYPYSFDCYTHDVESTWFTRDNYFWIISSE